jgi:hypothetical protein
VLIIGGAVPADDQHIVNAFREWETTKLQDYFKELQVKENLSLVQQRQQQQAQTQAGKFILNSYPNSVSRNYVCLLYCRSCFNRQVTVERCF